MLPLYDCAEKALEENESRYRGGHLGDSRSSPEE